MADERDKRISFTTKTVDLLYQIDDEEEHEFTEKDFELYDKMSHYAVWDDDETKGYYLNERNFPIAFFSLVAILAEDCGFNINKISTYNGNLYIEGSSENKENELMLRYLIPHQTEKCLIIVAKVKFIHKRSGNMTRLYEVLKQIQNEYNTGPIVIESALTEEIKGWCHKNNFIQKGLNFYQPVDGLEHYL